MAAPRSKFTTGYKPNYGKPLDHNGRTVDTSSRRPQGAHHGNRWSNRKAERQAPQSGGNVVGSDHPDRGKSGDFHEDRLRESRSRRMPQHVFDFSRLQHLHEGERPARRPLHHKPDLRHLRRQSRHVLDAMRKTWPTASGRRRWRSGSYNLGEAAEYMFDHNIFQDNLVGVDFCEQMVKSTNPGVLNKAENTSAPHGDIHGYKTIADIMRSFNPFTGEFYREALAMSRMTREMFCLMEGRHVHPSTLYPGGVGTVPSLQLFSDYLVRLMKYVEFMKKVVPLHDDLFDFFYEALPGYEEVGRRRILLGCWGSFQDPDVCDYNYKTMNKWGNAMFVTPGVVVDGQLVTTNLIDINLNIRILLGQSYYEDWNNSEMFVTKDPLGNPVDRRHPWNQTTIPKPQKRDFNGKYTWVMCPRWYDKRTNDHLALDTGGGAIARLWATALAGKVDIGYIKATGQSVKIFLPKTMIKPEVEFEWRIPKWSNAIERDRARTYFQAYAAAAANVLRREGPQGSLCRADEDFYRVQGARGRNRLRVPRGSAGGLVASPGHSRQENRELSSLSAHSLERQPPRRVRYARPVRGRRAGNADLRGERPGQFQGDRHHAPCEASILVCRAASTCIPDKAGW